MYRTVCAVSEQAADALSSMMPLDGSAIMRLGPFAVMVGTDKPRFEGLAICPHCITRAAMLLRDLANTCDNLVKEAEKHSKP